MTTNRAMFPDLLAEGLNELIQMKYKHYPKQFERFFNMKTSKKQKETDSSVSGFGVFSAKNEGSSISYEDPLQGYDVSYTHITYAKGFRVTEEMYDDDLYGAMEKMAVALGMSARQTVEIEAAKIFNYGFATTIFTGGDAKALFATDHPLTGGGTYQNKPTTDADLSMTSLQAAIQNMEDCTDDKGLLLAIKPKLLVVPSELKWTARELLGSDQKPYTANNEINALMDEGLTYSVWNYLTDSDAWFLLADKSEHNLKFFWRKQFVSEDEDDFDTGDHKFKGTMRFKCGFSDWRGAYGTSGGA